MEVLEETSGGGSFSRTDIGIVAVVIRGEFGAGLLTGKTFFTAFSGIGEPELVGKCRTLWTGVSGGAENRCIGGGGGINSESMILEAQQIKHSVKMKKMQHIEFQIQSYTYPIFAFHSCPTLFLLISPSDDSQLGRILQALLNSK